MALYILRLAGSFNSVVWCLGLLGSWLSEPLGRISQLFQYPLYVV